MIIAEWMGEQAKDYRGLMVREVERDANQKRRLSSYSYVLFFHTGSPPWQYP
jgi:hypothetical protein